MLSIRKVFLDLLNRLNNNCSLIQKHIKLVHFIGLTTLSWEASSENLIQGNVPKSFTNTQNPHIYYYNFSPLAIVWH